MKSVRRCRIDRALHALQHRQAEQPETAAEHRGAGLDERVQSDTRARMLRSTDPYLRDRLHDLDDLGHRLMRQLVGREHAPAREQLPDNAILVARSMGPDQVRLAIVTN